MVKVFIVYDTKYGNTKLVAEKIVEGMREIKGIETVVSDVKEVDLERIANSDAILIGSPNHWGGPSRTIR
ncbi:MAG TPA: flavodoxin family protein, partial [Thermoproteales archaeon]|nr:flavodoxin family protein [Thermoproteales archaeon]